jgi:hypothetical protein
MAAGVPALAKLHAINHATSKVVAAELLKETGLEYELAVTALAAALSPSILLGFLDGSRTSDRAGPGRGPSLLQLGPCDTGRAGPSFRAWPVKHGPGRAGPPAWPRPAGPGQETGQGRGLRPAFLVSEDPNFTVTVRSSPLPLYSACVVYSDEYLYSLSLL